MAKQRGLGRGLAEIRQAAGPRSGYHPFISSVAFAGMHDATGGATMDVQTGNILDASDESKDTYVVGKEPDTSGRNIATKKVKTSGEMMTKLPQMRDAILARTGGRENVSIGSWARKSGRGIDVDASGLDPNLGSALLKAKKRNEQAIFSTKKLRESGFEDGDILNPYYVPPKKK